MDADHLRPHAAAADPAPARRALGRQAARAASCSTRARCPNPPTRPRSCSSATSAPSGPATRRDVAAWAGVAQRDFAAAWERLETVAYTDEHGAELHDLPGAPLPPADTPLPRACSPTGTSRCSPTPTASASWRPRSQALQLTLSGDPTVTVDGRVAASWAIRDDVLEITPYVELSRAQREAIREEALRTAHFCGARP